MRAPSELGLRGADNSLRANEVPLEGPFVRLLQLDHLVKVRSFSLSLFVIVVARAQELTRQQWALRTTGSVAAGRHAVARREPRAHVTLHIIADILIVLFSTALNFGLRVRNKLVNSSLTFGRV